MSLRPERGPANPSEYVETTGTSIADARKAFAEQFPDAELCQVVRSYDAETWIAMGRRLTSAR